MAGKCLISIFCILIGLMFFYVKWSYIPRTSCHTFLYFTITITNYIRDLSLVTRSGLRNILPQVSSGGVLCFFYSMACIFEDYLQNYIPFMILRTLLLYFSISPNMDSVFSSLWMFSLCLWSCHMYLAIFMKNFTSAAVILDFSHFKVQISHPYRSVLI